MKEVKKLQADLDKDHNTFLQLRNKGSGMMNGKTMGVSKEMVQAYSKLRMTYSTT